MEPGQELEVEAKRAAAEGACVAEHRPGERIVFVPHAVPGDRLRVRIEEVKPRWARGRILEVLDAGRDRVEPDCPVHFRPGAADGTWCGGCDHREWRLEAQREAKRRVVADALRRIGRLPDAVVEPVLAGLQSERYRNKAMFSARLQGGAPAFGFFAPGGRAVVAAEDCLLQPVSTMRLLAAVRDLAREEGWTVYDEASGKGWLRQVLVRVNRAGDMMLGLVASDDSFPPLKKTVERLTAAVPALRSIHHNIQPEAGTSAPGVRWIRRWGEEALVETLAGLELELGPSTFLQVNTEAAETLYGVVREMLGRGEKTARLFDLFCGVGSIGLGAARDFEHVTGVEENPDAVEAAWRNAKRNKVRDVRFETGRVESVLRKLIPDAGGNPLAVVLDPPRAGCAPAVLKALAHRSVRKVVYVSCNPATFARDATRLLPAGFKLERVQPVDLFPYTAHVETAALFTRVAPAYA